jgi:hypothetical protein
MPKYIDSKTFLIYCPHPVAENLRASPFIKKLSNETIFKLISFILETKLRDLKVPDFAKQKKARARTGFDVTLPTCECLGSIGSRLEAGGVLLGLLLLSLSCVQSFRHLGNSIKLNKNSLFQRFISFKQKGTGSRDRIQIF